MAEGSGRRTMPGRWEGNEYITTAAGGAEIRLPYEMVDHCGFRASELRDMVWAFTVSDILEDGFISTRELRRALGRLGEAPTDKQFLKIMNEIDPHANGRHSFQHFVRVMSNFDRSLLTEDELVSAFKVFDRDRKGAIDAVDMQDLMSKLGFHVTPIEAHHIIEDADPTGSGQVTYSQFVSKVLNNQ